MNIRSLPWLTAVLAFGQWVGSFSKNFSSLQHIQRGKSIYHKIPKGARPVPVECCRCKGRRSGSLKTAYEKVVRVGKIKESIKYYIHEECEKE